MTKNSPTLLSDAALLAETQRAADVERRSTSHLLALLAELDARKLYLGLGYPSLFSYCTQVLRLSEPAAYSRITAARAARHFPVILELLADGAVTLTTISLLAAHLTDENHAALLSAATHKSRRDVECLVACLDPQPDVTSSLRRIRVAESAKASVAEALVLAEPHSGPPLTPQQSDVIAQMPLAAPRAAHRTVLAPLSA